MSYANIAQPQGENSMELDTRFGTVEVDPQSLITFPAGIPGFEDLKQYKLLHEEGAGTLFYLQSIEDPGLQLPLVTPDVFQVDYEIELSDEDMELLQVSKPEDISIMVTVSKHGDGSIDDVHANFMGPIIINTEKRLAIQKALTTISGTVVIRAK